MIKQNLRDAISQVCEDALVFDNPSFDDSIIGVSTSGSVIYSYAKMVNEFMRDENCSEQDAIDFIDYNTIRSLPYFASRGTIPTVMDDMDAEILDNLLTDEQVCDKIERKGS